MCKYEQLLKNERLAMDKAISTAKGNKEYIPTILKAIEYTELTITAAKALIKLSDNPPYPIDISDEQIQFAKDAIGIRLGYIEELKALIRELEELPSNN